MLMDHLHASEDERASALDQVFLVYTTLYLALINNIFNCD